MSGKSKRKSTPETDAGSVGEAKLPKLNLGSRGGKERLVASSLYQVAKSYRHNQALGTKFAVTKGEVIQFIRYSNCLSLRDGTEYVEVMNQFEKQFSVPRDVIDGSKMVAYRRCCNIKLFLQQQLEI